MLRRPCALPRVLLRRLHCGRAVRLPSFSTGATPSLNFASALPVLQTISAMRKQRELWAGGSVGLVPTMGALHSGHLELVNRAKKECDRVVVSVYVNPTQFGAGEDFSKYPRQLASDCQKLQGLADAVFAPSDALMYRRHPPHSTFVTLDGLHREEPAAPAPAAAGRVGVAGAAVAAATNASAAPLASAEAQARPTHFRGVATVVTKLFNIVQPTRAYFGAKDGMQCIVIRRVVRELNQPVSVVVCPTVREPDGLAMSSRNVYLSAADRAVAPIVYRALCAGKQAYADGERNADAIKSAVERVFAAEPRITIQYVSVADTLTGAELTSDTPGGVTLIGSNHRIGRERLEGEEEEAFFGASGSESGDAMLSVAVRLGNTRLIDNLLL